MEDRTGGPRAMPASSRMRIHLAVLSMLLAGCVVWTREDATTGMGLYAEKALPGTWVTREGDTIVIVPRSAQGIYAVRVFDHLTDFGNGDHWLRLNGQLVRLMDDLVMDVRAQGWDAHLQVYLRVSADSLWGWVLPRDSVRTWLQLHVTATPAELVESRDPNDLEPRLTLTGSASEVRRFLVDARMNHKSWFEKTDPALRVKK